MVMQAGQQSNSKLLVSPDQHPGAVDVTDLQRDDLGGAQAGAVGNAQGRLVLEACRRRQQPGHLFGTQHYRRPSRLASEHDIFGDVASSQRDPEEEAYRRHGGVHAGDAEAAGHKMQLITGPVQNWGCQCVPDIIAAVLGLVVGRGVDFEVGSRRARGSLCGHHGDQQARRLRVSMSP